MVVVTVVAVVAVAVIAVVAVAVAVVVLVETVNPVAKLWLVKYGVLVAEGVVAANDVSDEEFDTLIKPVV